ncbi:MAG: hypothetical protein BA863_10230 [Desulfovibrio sp. S3730MH75]|nr:MAG: hypothetical protein BA863_10230 [Desulfovibrio sp. S3730MH75]
MTDHIEIKVIKSEIPIIWIDTSIINLMTLWKFKLGRLERIQEERVSRLYNSIFSNTRKGRLICPLAEQEGEVWVERNKWFDTIQSLSLGIETEALFSIQHNQMHRFMKAYVNNDKTVTLNCKDAFHSDPVSELRDILKSPVFVSTRHPILFGEEYQKNIKNNIYQAMEDQRKKNVESKVTFEQQLEQEYIGELQALFILQKQFFLNNFKDDDDEFNATCGTINLNQQLMHWKSLTGRALDYKGLIEFYKSDYHKSMPFNNISCNLFAKLMTDKQPIRSGDVMDIKHASTLLPFSDIFITDKAMSTFLKQRNFNQEYNTTVCYIGDTEIIDEFFSRL